MIKRARRFPRISIDAADAEERKIEREDATTKRRMNFNKKKTNQSSK